MTRPGNCYIRLPQFGWVVDSHQGFVRCFNHALRNPELLTIISVSQAIPPHSVYPFGSEFSKTYPNMVGVIGGNWPRSASHHVLCHVMVKEVGASEIDTAC